MWWPAVGGLGVGIGGLIDPRVLGVGYDVIHRCCAATLSAGPLLRSLVVKALVWSFALGSGTSGGVLAPLLIIGGALGACEARWIPRRGRRPLGDGRDGRDDGRDDALPPHGDHVRL